MNGGILQKALETALPLELEYSEPSKAHQDQVTRFDDQNHCYDPTQYSEANEFYQLLAAL